MKRSPAPLTPRWFRQLKVPKQPKCEKCGEKLTPTPDGLVRWGCEEKECPYDQP